MSIFARSLAWLPRRATRRHAVKVLLGAAVAAATALTLVPSAGALVATVGETTVGLQPRRNGTLGEGSAAGFNNNTGAPVLTSTGVYAVYWDPTDVFHHHHEWLSNIDGFLQGVGGDSGSLGTMLAPLAQYRGRANQGARYNTVFKGAYTDTAAYPEVGNCTDPKPLTKWPLSCLTDAQLRAQLQTFIAARGLPTGMGTIYYLITPPGVTVCLDEASTRCSDFAVSGAEEKTETRASKSWKESFCSYHGDINPDAAPTGDSKTVLYAAIPWSAGTEGDYWEEASARVYQQAFDCQDGGYGNLEGEVLKFEEPKEATPSEEEILKGEKGTGEERRALERRRQLEGPHLQEPNQEGKGEEGDYSPGLSDAIVNQIAEEQANIVTDPLMDAWQDGTGHEVTDLCRDYFGSASALVGVQGTGVADEHTEAGRLSNQEFAGRRYWINNVYSRSINACVGAVGLVPRFTAPNPVNSGEVVGFDGLESTLQLLSADAFGPSGPPTLTYATFNWKFGDGTETTGYAPAAPTCEAPWLSPCAGSAYHSYQYGGKYTVTLTITDVGGYVSSVSHEVTVNGPAAPTTSGGSSSPGSTTGSGSGSGSGNGHAASTPDPVAAAAIISRSLKKATKKGLVVDYSVNEQVAGHFEVMVPSALAHRLKLGGAPAVGLPAGTAPQTVLAKAFLVTTKGGHSTMVIRFSKKVAQRLAHAGKASVLLRLIVRNAGTTPLTAIAISSATLSH